MGQLRDLTASEMQTTEGGSTQYTPQQFSLLVLVAMMSFFSGNISGSLTIFSRLFDIFNDQFAGLLDLS